MFGPIWVAEAWKARRMHTEPWPGEDDNNERYSPFALAIHAALADWFAALEDGTAHLRQPDPDGRMDWTEEQLNALVCDDIDAYVWQQADWVRSTRKLEVDAGPGFERLAMPQRIALAQQLSQIIEAHP